MIKEVTGIDSATYGRDEECRLLNVGVYYRRSARDEEVALLS